MPISPWKSEIFNCDMRLKSSRLIPISRWQRETSKGSFFFWSVEVSDFLGKSISPWLQTPSVSLQCQVVEKKKMQTYVSTLIGRKKKCTQTLQVIWYAVAALHSKGLSINFREKSYLYWSAARVGDRGICFASGIRLKFCRAIIIKKKKNTRERLWGIFLQRRRSGSCFTPDAEPLRDSQTEARRWWMFSSVLHL